MKQNQHWLKEKRMTDIELCDIIDRTYIPRLGKSGYAQLTAREADAVRKQLLRVYQAKISFKQLDRCLHILR